MKANNTLKGQALHTYNRVLSAMAEDNTTSMCHTFAALTQQAKAIVLQSGKFANAYIRGELKGMAVEEAAKDLTARAAACVSCKVRNIDTVITTAFLAEYISRQRKEITTPETPNPSTSNDMNTDTTPATMNEQTSQYFRNVYGTYENMCRQADERLATLRNELQEYHNNHSKGGSQRRRNIQWLKEDIKKLEQQKEECKQAFEVKGKTMQEIENQAYRLGERNWRRRNVWESSAASKAAKNSRDKLINKAYLNTAAKHLTIKAKAISEFLSVRPMHEEFCVMLDFNSPSVGMALKIASPFCVEALLNDPEQVLAFINA